MKKGSNDLPVSNPRDSFCTDVRVCFMFPLLFFFFDLGVITFATRSWARLSADSVIVVNVLPIFLVPLVTAFPNDFKPAPATRRSIENKKILETLCQYSLCSVLLLLYLPLEPTAVSPP